MASARESVVGVVVQTVDESKRVLDLMDRKEARVLVRTAGYGRGVIRRLIRRSKKNSSPGEPPRAHVPGKRGLKDVRYQVTAYDASVIIGHKKYPPSRASKPNKKGTTRKVKSSTPVPQLLNDGGSATMELDNPRTGAKSIPLTYKKRPFRDKAFDPTLEFFKKRIAKERL